MNRYDIKDVDCILAFSGGLDCTALLHHLLEQGRKPYIFTYEQTSNSKINDFVNQRIDQIKKHYKVPVVNWQLNVEANNNGFADRERTKQYYENVGPSIVGGPKMTSNPILSKWPVVAYWINYYNPWIEEIYWGMCYGGLLEFGDQKGDKLYNYNKDGILDLTDPLTEPMDKSNYDDRHKKFFEGLMSNLKDYGINTQFISPLGHKTKLELYNMVPQEVRFMCWTCLNMVSMYRNTGVMEECGKCFKCEELSAVRKACAEGL